LKNSLSFIYPSKQLTFKGGRCSSPIQTYSQFAMKPNQARFRFSWSWGKCQCGNDIGLFMFKWSMEQTDIRFTHDHHEVPGKSLNNVIRKFRNTIKTVHSRFRFFPIRFRFPVGSDTNRICFLTFVLSLARELDTELRPVSNDSSDSSAPSSSTMSKTS